MTPDISDVVIAQRGRDAGRRFLIVGFDGELALISDGRTRRMEKPKRKKLGHLTATGENVGRVADKLRGGEKVTNGEIRRALAHLAGENEVKGGMCNG